MELSGPEVTELVGRTEGWPAGLYLDALARLSPALVEFLTRTAVLERMCGPLGDAVLDTTGRRRGMWRTGRRRRRSTLTTAELRLLPLVATHLTLAEIGQRLYVSKHTVKIQAISIYRKLGASSRSQAVQRLQEIGLRGV